MCVASDVRESVRGCFRLLREKEKKNPTPFSVREEQENVDRARFLRDYRHACKPRECEKQRLIRRFTGRDPIELICIFRGPNEQPSNNRNAKNYEQHEN